MSTAHSRHFVYASAQSAGLGDSVHEVDEAILQQCPVGAAMSTQYAQEMLRRVKLFLNFKTQDRDSEVVDWHSEILVSFTL